MEISALEREGISTIAATTAHHPNAPQGSGNMIERDFANRGNIAQHVKYLEEKKVPGSPTSQSRRSSKSVFPRFSGETVE